MRHGPMVLAVAAVTLALFIAGAPGVAQALTPEQCQYFASNGKVSICHRTQSAKTPYVPMLLSVEACAAGHSDHAGDYVGFNDPMCLGVACLPVGAPSDGTVECCEGSTPQDGVCVLNAACGTEGEQASSAAECCSGRITEGICQP